MDMREYVAEIDPALRLILPFMWAEHQRWREAQLLSEQKKREAEAGYRAASGWLLAEDVDDYMLGVGLHWDTYFGADKERHFAERAAQEANEQIIARSFSRGALAGAVLQFAKQAISVVHRGLAACPDGRRIGGQAIKTIIWQGRNQGLHWEAGVFNDAVERCFQQLAEEVKPTFADYRNQSLAFEVVELLGWESVEAVREDLLSLA